MEPNNMEKGVRGNTYKITEKVWPFAKLVLILALGITLANLFTARFVGPTDDASLSQDSNNDKCNTIGINLHGTLMTYVPPHAEGDNLFDYDVTASEDVAYHIYNANTDDDIKAIIVEVDSGGGSPVAGEEIAAIISASKKPVIAFVRDWGASAAYWAISSADKIYVSKNSEVGGIGVSSSYLNQVKKNENEGYEYERLIAGKYKDYGSPDVPLTAEEKSLIQRDLNIIYENFIATISTNRNIPIEKVREMADGATVLGERAIELGLVDQIGGIEAVRTHIKELIGEDSEICWQ